MKIKTLIKHVVPPVLIHFKNLVINGKPKFAYSGNYANWQAAKKESKGYEADNILEKCKQALLKVKNGDAVAERDSVLFDKVQYSWPVLAALQHITLANNGHLNVLDFGGSLGTTYFANKFFLNGLTTLSWTIVEQEHYVTCGKKYFENNELKFSYSIDESLNKNSNLILSGVLQCLDKPFDYLKQFLTYNFKYILIDRTAFINDKQRITILNIPAYIYQASYPLWFFNEEEFLAIFTEKYELLADFDSEVDGTMQSEDKKQLYWKGYFFKLKS